MDLYPLTPHNVKVVQTQKKECASQFLQCSNPKWWPKTYCIGPNADKRLPKLLFSSCQVCLSTIRALTTVQLLQSFGKQQNSWWVLTCVVWNKKTTQNNVYHQGYYCSSHSIAPYFKALIPLKQHVQILL